MATNSGGICIPPTKLNPFNTGLSKSIGEPEIKYIIIGNRIIEAALIKNSGYCLPVSSCLRFAHLEKNIDPTIAIIIAAVTKIKLSP